MSKILLWLLEYLSLCTLAGAERGSRVLQGCPNIHCGRVRAAKDASHDPFRVLERRHALAEIVEGGGGVLVERHRVNPPLGGPPLKGELRRMRDEYAALKRDLADKKSRR